MPFFIYATLSRDRILLESSVGPCPFCQTKDCIDIVEQRSTTTFFGLFPSESTDRLACCNHCGRAIKEIHYNFRVKPIQTFQPSGTKINDHDHDDIDTSNTVVKPVHVVVQNDDDMPVVVQALEEENLTTTLTTTTASEEEGGNNNNNCMPTAEAKQI